LEPQDQPLPEQNPTRDGPWTIRRVLEWTLDYLGRHGSETPRLDAEVLLAFACNCPRIQLYTRYDEELPEPVRARMRELVRRRADAEPVAYLVGHREFFSLDFEVTPEVFIPRPDTETLVVEALERLETITVPDVLELGTGSGCIAVALARNHPRMNVTAVDVSPAALTVARRNADRNGVADRIRFLESELFAAVPAGELFDVVLSNPPYIPQHEVPELDPQVSRHEPELALAGGPDGLDVIRRIVAESPRFLRSGGLLLLECSPEQTAVVAELMAAGKRFDGIQTCADLSGAQRVVLGRRV
jgi:release factor glutamine methyltransferase